MYQSLSSKDGIFIVLDYLRSQFGEDGGFG